MAPYGRIIVDDQNGHGEMVPVAISELRLHADTAALACVGRGADLMSKCGFWEFRGRYGAYLVDVVFDLAVGFDKRKGPMWQDLPKDHFLEVVRSVDGHVAQVIGD